MEKEVIQDLREVLKSVGIYNHSHYSYMCSVVDLKPIYLTKLLNNDSRFATTAFAQEALRKIKKFLLMKDTEYRKAIHHIERIIDYGF